MCDIILIIVVYVFKTYTPSASEGDQKQYMGEKDGKGISVGHVHYYNKTIHT